jgi:hypothetical protein
MKRPAEEEGVGGSPPGPARTHSGSKEKKEERRDVSTHSDLLFLHLRHWASGPSRSGPTFDLLPFFKFLKK